MSKLNVVIFTSLCRSITGCIAVWIWVFLVYYPLHFLGKIVRIPGFVEDRFPKPYARTISVSSYDVSDIAIYIVGEARFRIPELPSRGIFDYKQSQFITSIHKGRVLRIMGISDDTQSSILQFLGISPMQTVRQSIADYGKILVAIGTDQWFRIRFAVEPEAIASLKLQTSDTYSYIISIHYLVLLILHIDIETIEVWMIWCPEVSILDGSLG